MCAIVLDLNASFYIFLNFQELAAKAAGKGPLTSGGIKKSGKKWSLNQNKKKPVQYHFVTQQESKLNYANC